MHGHAVPDSTMTQRVSMLGCGLTAVVALAIVAWFHNRFWWPPDEGVYAYVAQRVLRGDVLNGDVQDMHAGLVHFIHALAFRLFGEDLLSLRYPLAALTVVQTILVWRVLAPRGAPAALAGAIATAALSFVQFLNPSANWYALFLMFACAALLAGKFATSRWSMVALGALLGLAVLIRHPSGVILAMGCLTWLLARPGLPVAGASAPRLARAVIGIMGAGVLLYFFAKASLASFILFGAWPLLLLGLAWRQTVLTDRATLALLANIAAGGALALAPLFAYHVYFGTLASWFSDTVLTALHLTEILSPRAPSYAYLPLLSIGALLQEPGLRGAGSAAFWLALLAAPVVLGFSTFARAVARRPAPEWHPLPIVASFFAMVSAHYEIPIYLFFSTAAVLAGLAWNFADSARGRYTALAIVLFLAIFGLVFQAAQPMSRTLRDIARSQTRALTAPAGLPHARLAMESDDQRVYSRLVELVTAHAPPCTTVLAVPMHPEINFLADRAAPLRFYSTALGLKTQAEADKAAERLAAAPAAVLVHRREDKYNTPLSNAFFERVRTNYKHLERVGGFDVYLSIAVPPASARGCRARAG